MASRRRRSCRDCKRPVDRPDRTRCRPCRARENAAQSRRRQVWDETGLCREGCGRARLTTRFCVACWYERVAYTHLGSRRLGPALREMWRRQRGRCALTGVRLRIGSGASIDHIVPRARGGPDTLANVRWVHCNANQAKAAMLDKDFLALCRAVVRTARKKAA